MQKIPIEGFIEVSSVTMLRLSSKVGWSTHLIENCILDFFGPENESLEFILSITIFLFCGRNNWRRWLTSRCCCCCSWRRRWCRRRRLMTTMATKPSAQNWHFFETLMNIVSKGHSNVALRKKISQKYCSQNWSYHPYRADCQLQCNSYYTLYRYSARIIQPLLLVVKRWVGLPFGEFMIWPRH